MTFVSSVTLSLATEVSEDETVRYVHADSGFELVIDRDKRTSTSTSFPAQGPRTPKGHIITDSMSYGYGDCSTTTLVCADFGEFMLSVPRHASALNWEREGWVFKRTACLSDISGSCDRYVVTFQSARQGHEGGFIYSSERGIEMYFDANISRKDQRQIYVLATRHGLLHGGRP